MRTHYWDRDAPDMDDTLLQQAVAEGLVPKTCLWGGAMIQQVASLGEDTCALCPCPKRERCGGRPRRQEQPQPDLEMPAELRGISNNESGARKLIRTHHKKTILGWLAEGAKKKETT